MKFTSDGRPLMTVGVKGYRSDTGVAPDELSSTAYQSVTHGGGPFNMPAGIALNEQGQIFIADGYANARVHKFSPQGELLLSWGEPGVGPGEFNLPHGVWIDRFDRVLVADRENDRVQVFTQDGEYLETWPTELIGPALFFVTTMTPSTFPSTTAACSASSRCKGSPWPVGAPRSTAPAMASGLIPEKTYTS